MIDVELTREIILESSVLSLLGGAVRLIVPPSKQSLRRFFEVIISAVFVGVVLAFFTEGRFSEEEQGIRIAIILVAGYLGTNILSTLIDKYEVHAKDFMKKGGWK